ncbi:MAG: hypothetical protein K5894_11185, partial [Lachnospiraceae bacterium]|nr:hypothetical protein [Lachnospiraceae bacterium]
MTEEMLLEMIKGLTKSYFLNQILIILALFLLGLVFLHITDEETGLRRILMSFPMGLALFSVAGAFLLMVGIPFNPVSAALAPILIIVILFFIKKRRLNFTEAFVKKELLALIVVIIIAAISSSGIFSLNVSNDSVYYYSSFPAMLVEAGAYAKSFDTYLTNVGQTSAVLNCLPFLYGFDTSFGIQHFMNINFILIFAEILYEDIFEIKKSVKTAVIAAIAGTFFLASSTPFLIISKWVLSNVYFMDYSFILFYLLKRDGGKKRGFSFSEFILFAMVTMIRQEGTVMVLLLIIAASSFEYTNKRLGLNFVLPVFLMEAFYYLMLFLRLGVDPLYSFLDWKKAVLVLGATAAVGFYVLVMRGKFLKIISDNINTVLIIAVAAGNVAILAVSHSRYLTNLYAFYQNIRIGNGWGYFGIFLAIAIVFMALEIIINKFRNISYNTAYIAAMLMTTIAVAWARGG